MENNNEEIKNENLEEVKEETVNTVDSSEDVNPEKTVAESEESVETPSEVEGEVIEGEVDEKHEEEKEGEDDTVATDEPESESDETTEDTPTDEPVDTEEKKDEEEDETPQPTVEDLTSQIDELKFEQELQTDLKGLEQFEQRLSVEANNVLTQTQQAVEMAAKKFGIPLDKTMDELMAEDPQKAALAKEILGRAQEMINQKNSELVRAREDAAANIVFKKAERLFNKYKLNQAQAEEAAATFIDIIKETGVNDLGEDIKNKVELSVARALMKHPVVMEVHEKVEELKKEEPIVDTTVSKTPSEKIETKEEPKAEVKSDVPPTKDLSAYMEGPTDGVSNNVNPITIDNVLEVHAKLPFKERTAFYKEHIDLINEAMSKRR